MRTLISGVWRLFRQFLRWWLAELAGLVPERVRAALGPRSDVVIVDASCGPEITVTRATGSRHQELGRLPHPDAAPGDQAATGRIGSLTRLRGEVVLRVPAGMALRKSLNLPQAAEANLREIVYFELDRQTPFRADEVYFECRVRERLAGAQRTIVDLTVLTRAMVDPILAWLAQWGLEPVRIESAGPPEDGWACRLPARDEAGEAGAMAFTRMLNPGLAALALVLAGTAVYLPLMEKEGLLRELRADLVAQQRAADETLALKEQLASLREEALHVVNQKRQSPPFLEVWNEITRIMPDHSFALELRTRQQEVELLGESKAATGLLDVVEGSSLFQRPTFRSPITRGQSGEAERFHLAFEVRRSEPEQRAER